MNEKDKRSDELRKKNKIIISSYEELDSLAKNEEKEKSES